MSKEEIYNRAYKFILPPNEFLMVIVAVSFNFDTNYVQIEWNEVNNDTKKGNLSMWVKFEDFF